MASKNKFDLKLLGRVLKLALPYKRMFWFAAFISLAVAPIAILRPWLVQHTVDQYIMKLDGEGLLLITAVLIVVLIVESLFRYFQIYSTNLLGQSVIRDLRVRVFRHITSLKTQYFDTTPIGTSTTRTINDIETINSIFTQGIIAIISDVLTMIAVMAIMFYTSWKLTLVCLITFPLLIFATYIFKEKVKAAFEIVRNQIALMNAFLQERISGMRIVQIFNAEENELKKFKVINREYTQANLDSIFYYAVFFPVVQILSAASLGLLVWWGAKGVLSGEVTLGVLIAFPIYLNMLFRPLRMLADRFNTLQMGLVASNRVFDLLDLEDKIEDKGTLQVEKLQGEIEFKDVEFSYIENTPILKKINFKINPGETLAIVGSTGSGKTTIINILNRFYEIQGGEIRIDGRLHHEYQLENLRKHFSMVLQDVFLFSGSVLENITLRNPSISREAAIKAAKLIGAHDFIQKLPDGYDYEVMERGATLSMGQRQLISFVRALVINPDILILDEATSSIDPESEAIIQYAIEQLITKRTSIIIAHRLSTIRHATNILVLDKGVVVEYGSHDELLQIEDGHYRQLHDMQFLQVEAL